MFITSRESAITVSRFPLPLSALPFHVGNAEEIWENQVLDERVRVYFGVPSISQRVARGSQREFPGFAGFCGVLLEFAESGITIHDYILGIDSTITIHIV